MNCVIYCGIVWRYIQQYNDAKVFFSHITISNAESILSIGPTIAGEQMLLKCQFFGIKNVSDFVIVFNN